MEVEFRIKLLLVLLPFGLTFLNVLPSLHFLLVFSLGLALVSLGYRKVISLLWSLKWIILLASLILILISPNFLTLNFLEKFLIMIGLLAFLTTQLNSSELYDLMIKSKFPHTFAWTVTQIQRNMEFFVDEFQILLEIHKSNLDQGFLLQRIKARVKFSTSLLILAYVRAIQRAKILPITLRSRGWKGAHENLFLNITPKPTNWLTVLLIFSVELIAIIGTYTFTLT